MKHLYFFFFISVFSFSQTSKSDKLTFKEYDAIKYISTIDKSFVLNSVGTRYFDINGVLLYSVFTYSELNKNVTLKFYSDSLLEYIITDNIANVQIENVGVLKIFGSNYFYTLSICNAVEGCYFYQFINDKKYSQTTSKKNNF